MRRRDAYHRPMAPKASLVALMLLVTACTGSADPDATGAELYGQFCARCHAADLSGGVGPALGVDSAAADRSDEFVADVITGGRGSMPAFGSTLDDELVDRLVAFIRERQSR